MGTSAGPAEITSEAANTMTHSANLAVASWSLTEIRSRQSCAPILASVRKSSVRHCARYKKFWSAHDAAGNQTRDELNQPMFNEFGNIYRIGLWRLTCTG